MRPDPILQFRLGLAAIGLFILIAIVWAFAPAVLDRRSSVQALFNEVTNLAEGAEVRDGGFVVGRVIAIEPQRRQRRFLVRFLLDRDWTLPPDSAAVIEVPNPLQAADLAITHGEACPDPAYDPALTGQQLRGCGRKPSIIDVSFQTIATAKIVLERMNAILTVVGPAVASAQGNANPDENLLARVNATLANVRDLTGSARTMLDAGHRRQLDTVLQNLTDVSTGLKTTVASVNGLIGTEERRQQVDTIAANAASLSTSADKLLKTSAEPAEQSLADLRYILAVTATSMSGIASNMEATTANLRDITVQLRDNPSSVLRSRQRSDPTFVNIK